VAIIDYGVGNLRSVEKAFAAMGCEAVVTSDESLLRRSLTAVLGGVVCVCLLLYVCFVLCVCCVCGG